MNLIQKQKFLLVVAITVVATGYHKPVEHKNGFKLDA